MWIFTAVGLGVLFCGVSLALIKPDGLPRWIRPMPVRIAIAVAGVAIALIGVLVGPLPNKDVSTFVNSEDASRRDGEQQDAQKKHADELIRSLPSPGPPPQPPAGAPPPR